MSTATFMPFVDQENTTSTHQGKLMTPAPRNRTFGKTFSSSSATPEVRKALGDVKNQLIQSTLRPSVKPTPQKSNFVKQMPVFSTSSVTTSKQPKPTLPDIEHIATRGHDPDDFSDLWPLDEQPLTYLPDIIAWRPPSQIFPCGCDSESDVSLDDEWIERQLDMITDSPADVELQMIEQQTDEEISISPLPPPPMDEELEF